MLRQLLISASLALTLAACGGDNQNQPAAQVVSSTALPSDPVLADIYQASCMACHSRPASGAPQTGSAADWEARLAKGNDVLLDNTINGFRGMPPLGSCFDCGEEEFAALIEFMATPQ
jgi:cytochrome c5